MHDDRVIHYNIKTSKEGQGMVERTMRMPKKRPVAVTAARILSLLVSTSSFCCFLILPTTQGFSAVRPTLPLLSLPRFVLCQQQRRRNNHSAQYSTTTTTTQSSARRLQYHGHTGISKRESSSVLLACGFSACEPVVVEALVGGEVSSLPLLSSSLALKFPMLTTSFLPSASVVKALELGAFPALGMNLVTWLGLGVATPRPVVGALQHFSAGILFTTIAKELLPEMVQATGWAENIASGIGFFAGVATLIVLGLVLPTEEEEEQVEEETMKEHNHHHLDEDAIDGHVATLAATTTATATSDNDEEIKFNNRITGTAHGKSTSTTGFATESETAQELMPTSSLLSSSSSVITTELESQSTTATTPEEEESAMTTSDIASNLSSMVELWTLESTATPSLRNRRMSKQAEAYILAERENTTTTTTTTTTIPSNHNGLMHQFFDWNVLKNTVSTLPLALLAAVAIDSALDGLLIGISTAVDPKTGPLLSASLTVESSFLGLTIAAALRGSAAPTVWLLLAASVAPLGILAGSLSGGGLAPMLSTNPVLFAGFLGFGTSTTLFMVAEELLLEAHEDGSDHIWWVDLQLYTGFFASVMIEKVFGM